MHAHTFALAQTAPVAGDVEANIEQHLAFTDLAAKHGASLIAFPELSLTAYELQLADKLAFEPNDRRLEPLRKKVIISNITIVAGAPIRLANKLHIGAFILQPDGTELIYTKRYPHFTETPYIEAGTLDPKITIGEDTLSFAICADIAEPQHGKDAAASNSSIYLTMALISIKGYPIDSAILEGYAKEHNMDVFLSNYCTPTGGYDSAGRSAVWMRGGELSAELSSTEPSLMLATRSASGWDCRTVALKQEANYTVV